MKKIKIELNFIIDVTANSLLIDKLTSNITVHDTVVQQTKIASYEHIPDILTVLKAIITRWTSGGKINITSTNLTALKNLMNKLK